MDLKDPSPDVQNKEEENISVHFCINIYYICIYTIKVSIFFSYLIIGSKVKRNHKITPNNGGWDGT